MASESSLKPIVTRVAKMLVWRFSLALLLSIHFSFLIVPCDAFTPTTIFQRTVTHSKGLSPLSLNRAPKKICHLGKVAPSVSRLGAEPTRKESWSGEVVSNAGGKIKGCSLQVVAGKTTEWIVTIDGVEADLGRFSEAIYKKIIGDAKQQRFQGFRPGTIPPQLEPTYRAYTMDECARETVLEAMQQNSIRPFENARSEMHIESLEIPPPVKKGGKKKSKGRKTSSADQVTGLEDKESSTGEWLRFDNMKDAITAGWKPGQSFSFVAKGVKGQQVKDASETKGATPLGLNF